MAKRKAWNPEDDARGGSAGAGLIARTTLQQGTAAQRRRDTDLVYNTSAWQRYQWGEFAGHSPDALATAEEGQKDIERWPAYMREVFTRMYAENPQRLEDTSIAPANGWAEQAHEIVEELPEWERLRDRCRGDRMWSGLSATALSEEVLHAMPTPEERVEDTDGLERQLRGLGMMEAQGIPCSGVASGVQNEIQRRQRVAGEFKAATDIAAIRQAIRKGIEKANANIDEAQAMLDAFGWGDEAGSGGRGGNIEQKRQLMAKVAESDKLKAMAELAGRMRRVAASKQRSKADYRRDEVNDITVGDDLARLLPVEALKFCDPELEFIFFKDLAERSLLNYELRGMATQGRGPIICAIDNSGSMSGSREMWSKAVALALLDIARSQKRDFVVLHFDTEVQAKLVWEHGPNAPSWEHIIEMMEFFSGGGTDFEPVLRESLELMEESSFNKADIILITDGAAGTWFAEEYRKRAELKQATTYGIQIGGGYAGAMDSFCDRHMEISATGGPNEATDVVFEI